MIATNEFRKGLKIEIDGAPYVIVSFEHVKPGKGNAFTRVRFKSLIDGRVLDQTLKSGDRVQEANTQEREMQYLYVENGLCNFMDNTNYEQIQINQDIMKDEVPFLNENMMVNILFFNDKPIGVRLPNFVELPVKECDPGVRGDTASGATKWATLNTGLKLTVPLHIKEGDVLKIDTREGGSYVEKVNTR